MKPLRILALALLMLLAASAAPAFAQAPAPKVTITGFIDFLTAWSQNFQDADSTRKETEWYSRERARLFITGEVGKAKAVWGVELDFANGNTVTNHPGTSAGFDLDTDVAGVVETKWLYVEFPFTGPGSLLPFIRVDSVARGGGQPFAGHDFKPGILASGDFGGFSLMTTFSPAVKNTLTFAQIEEENAKTERPTRSANRESWAIINSLEFAPTKELTAKPTFSYASYGGANQGSSRFGTPPRGGLDQLGLRLWRGTVGGDLRWRSGSFVVEPTFHYQFGEQQTNVPLEDVDISAWIVDVIGGWRSGPLNLEGRFVYTSGNSANECPAASGVCAGGSDINSYTPIHPASTYFGDWSEVWTLGNTDYVICFLCGNNAVRRDNAIGYDKYGLLTFAVRATYALTPVFSLIGIVSPSWTAQDVDTNGQFTANGIVPFDGRGDESYLGTEVVLGFTWSFAPGLRFDGRYAHLFAGDALNQCQITGGCTNAQVREAKDVDFLVARVRLTF